MEKVKKKRLRTPERRLKDNLSRKIRSDRKYCETYGLVYEDYILDKIKYKKLLGHEIGYLLGGAKTDYKASDHNKNQLKNSEEHKMVTKLLKHARIRCRKTGVPYDISHEDVTCPSVCPYLGIKLNLPNKLENDDNNCSIDRIIPELGYVTGNVQIISMKANTMKSNATVDEMLSFARNVIRMHAPQNTTLVAA